MKLDVTKQYLVEEFAEEYELGQMPRRELVQRTVLLAGGMAAAASVLRGLIDVKGVSAASKRTHATIAANVEPVELRAAATGEPGARTLPPTSISTADVVAPDDPAIIINWVEAPGEAGPVWGYLARPSAPGSYPAIIVIHENRGVIEPNGDIARRFAKEGYVALAVDLLSRAGGTNSLNGDPMAIMAAHGAQTDATRLADMLTMVNWLKTQPYVNTRAGMGVIGFCFGGGMAFLLAANSTEIRAATPFYGSTNPALLASGTRAAILAFYGATDVRTTAQETEVRAAMAQAGKSFDSVIYLDTGHAFFNNYLPAGGNLTYNPVSAADAWRRTLAFFMQNLG